MLLPDGDEVEANCSSHLSPMDFSGNCCRNAVTPTRRRMSLAHHANCRKLPTASHDGFANSCWNIRALWPRGRTSSPGDGSQDMVGKASQDRRALRLEPRAVTVRGG